MKKIHFMPLILFVVSFLLRLSLISKGPYHVDTLSLAINAQHFVNYFELKNQFGSGYPLTILLGAFFIKSAQFFHVTDPIIAVNFMSVLLSALCIPVLYKIAKTMYSSRAAFFAAVSFSLTPIFLGVSVYGKSHVPSLLFLLLGILFLLKHQNKHQQKYLWYSASMIGFMGACRLQDMILMLPALSFLLTYHLKPSQNPLNLRIKLKKLSLFWPLVAGITIIFHIPFLLTSSKNYNSQLFQFIQIGVTDNFKGFFSDSLLLTFQYLLQSLTHINLIFFIIGFILLFIKENKLFIFTFLWILFPLLFYGNLNTTAPRFFVIFLPALFIPIGITIDYFTTKKNIVSLLLIIIFIGSNFLMLDSIYPLLKIRHDNAFLPDYVKWVKNNTKDNAYIISGDDRLFFNYYANINSFSKPLKVFNLSNQELYTFQKKLDTALVKKIPIYINYIGLYDHDPQKRFSTFIKNNYRLEEVGEHIYEDWHQGEMEKRIFYNPLLEILPKSNSPQNNS